MRGGHTPPHISRDAFLVWFLSSALVAVLVSPSTKWRAQEACSANASLLGGCAVVDLSSAADLPPVVCPSTTSDELCFEPEETDDSVGAGNASMRCSPAVLDALPSSPSATASTAAPQLRALGARGPPSA